MWPLPCLTNSEHLTSLEKLLHQGHCGRSYSVRATMTKNKNKKHKLCDLNSRSLFLLVLGSRMSKVKVPARWVSFWGLFSWFIGGHHPAMCSHDLLFVSVEKKSKLPISILLRAPSHHEGPILLISSKPNYLPKTSSPNTFILRTRDSTYGFGGYMDIKSIIGPEKVLVAQSCQTLCHPIV